VRTAAMPRRATVLRFPIRPARVKRKPLSPEKRLKLVLVFASCARNAIRWGRPMEAYWQARFACRFARPLLLLRWKGWPPEIGGEG